MYEVTSWSWHILLIRWMKYSSRTILCMASTPAPSLHVSRSRLPRSVDILAEKISSDLSLWPLHLNGIAHQSTATARTRSPSCVSYCLNMNLVKLCHLGGLEYSVTHAHSPAVVKLCLSLWMWTHKIMSLGWAGRLGHISWLSVTLLIRWMKYSSCTILRTASTPAPSLHVHVSLNYAYIRTWRFSGVFLLLQQSGYHHS